MSRPSQTTPHRVSSRSSIILPQSPRVHYSIDADNLPLERAGNLKFFEDFSDGLVDFDLNMKNLQVVHESLTSFNESFSSFLYGLQMNAWCIEFVEGPTKESFDRAIQMAELERKINEAEENVKRLRSAAMEPKTTADKRKSAEQLINLNAKQPKPNNSQNDEAHEATQKSRSNQPNLNQPARYLSKIPINSGNPRSRIPRKNTFAGEREPFR